MKKIYVDMDGVIADTPFLDGKNRYELSTPIKENIEKINSLYDKGEDITIWTARGADSKVNWTKLTKKQLDDWGVKYHRLSILEKPSYDVIIDDKCIKIEDL